MKKAIMYVHGKGGSHSESVEFEKSCIGFHIVGVDYNDYFPWIVQSQIQNTYNDLKTKYDEIYILANRIGAYFSMHTLQNSDIKKALFISPILNMESLILDMMVWANVTEKELQKAGEIQTDFGETLSWKYLQFVRENPINWNVPTEILYAEKDNLVSKRTVVDFIENHNANLTIMENGEHWFHTEEQLAFLDKWIKKVI